jgi:hypothetical protein
VPACLPAFDGAARRARGKSECHQSQYSNDADDKAAADPQALQLDVAVFIGKRVQWLRHARRAIEGYFCESRFRPCSDELPQVTGEAFFRLCGGELTRPNVGELDDLLAALPFSAQYGSQRHEIQLGAVIPNRADPPERRHQAWGQGSEARRSGRRAHAAGPGSSRVSTELKVPEWQGKLVHAHLGCAVVSALPPADIWQAAVGAMDSRAKNAQPARIPPEKVAVDHVRSSGQPDAEGFASAAASSFHDAPPPSS